MKNRVFCLLAAALAIVSAPGPARASEGPENAAAEQAVPEADPLPAGVFYELDGKWYYSSGGLFLTGWHTDAGGVTRYFDPNAGGAMATGLLVIEGSLYDFGPSGSLGRRYGPVVPSQAGSLAAAETTDQILTVAVSGTSADVSMHVMDSTGAWYELLRTEGTIGANGLGKTVQGDKKTPVGLFHFTKAFGIESDPGSVIPYTQVDDSHYWVGDPNSRYYNQFVSTSSVARDWDDAEHLIDYPVVYDHVLALDYNSDNTPGLGSAIFLHCWRDGGTTLGCVAIPKSAMIRLLGIADTECAVIIDAADKIRDH